MGEQELFDRLARWGTTFSPEMIEDTLGLYGPLAPKPDEARVTRDIAYGPHERHRLDLFRSGAKAPAPCVLFVHGGGFVMGDKGAPGAPFHNNVGAWAMDAGLACATISYRLAPEVQWPAGREDVIAAVRHLADHAGEYGIDPARIVLMGTSAGATHVADAVASPGTASGSIAGAVMISGIYDLAIAERDRFKPAYYGEPDSDWSRASSLPGLVETDIPCLFTVSELDPADFQKQAAALVAAWVAAKGFWPRIRQLEGHNHISSCSQLGSAHDSLGPVAARFIHRI